MEVKPDSTYSYHLAIGTEIYLPYTQTWIYRQMDAQHVKLVLCNEVVHLTNFPFHTIVEVPHRSLLWRKVVYKLQPVLKHIPFFVSTDKWEKYYKALKAYRIDLLHVHFGIMGVELMSVCEYAKIPLIVTFHGYDITSAVKRSPSYKKALFRLFSHLKVAIAISEEMKMRLMHLGCPSDKIVVSYLGIPVEEFPYIDRSERTGPVIFLHAGRFSATKGVPDLIDAFSSAFLYVDDVELIIVGQGEEKEQIEKAIERSRIKHKIRLEGSKKSKEMVHLFNTSDVFVLNSRTAPDGDQEGLPIALLEAASTGLPVISTFHAGIPEAVKDGVTGVLVEEYDQEALSNAMRNMMSKSLRLRYGQQGRLFMEEQFDLKKCNQVLHEIYKQAVQA